jgi:hypothetical protein
MIRAALLQQTGNRKLEPEVRSLSIALTKRGIPCSFFTEKQLHRRQLPLQRHTLVAGHIPVVLGALRQLGVELPVPDDYPQCLLPFLHRRIWKSVVRDVVAKLQEGLAEPFFAKPFARHKRFRGHVFRGWDDLRMLGGASDRAEVWCSEIVEWLSEYRVYVVKGQIVGTGHYAGNPSIAIDMPQAQEAVACFEASENAPAGYGIDFGVLRSGQTAMIEVNDGYSLGNYALSDELYADLIEARWTELMAPPVVPQCSNTTSGV